MNKVRFELGLSEWAECGKLITKSKLKGILEKAHSIIKDGKIGKTIMCQAQG